MNKGLISVIMGVFNCEKTIDEAISSIINQTYTNWELIICDDFSTDSTLDILISYANKYSNIKVLKNKKNMGLNYTLNKCLASSNGEYIARMDGDDVSNINRFEEEINLLMNCPNISIVSTEMKYFDENGIWGRCHMKERPESIDLLYGTIFCHAPCMVRKEAYDAVGGYSISPLLLRVEDWHLWIKMYSQGFIGVNIKKPLYNMRDDRNAYSRRKFKFRINEAYVILNAIKLLKLKKMYMIYALRPILVGILPKKMYFILHKKRVNHKL